jgi:FMN phosphatase YigB (HAD superfamily)
MRSSTSLGGLEADQLRLACEATGEHPDLVHAVLRRWMEREPLALVSRHARPGLSSFLSIATRRGVRLGVFSDYPAARKLAALGIAPLIEVAMCAQDAAVRRLKPDPSGLLTVAECLGISVEDTAYVGDRPDIDTAAAREAGMHCIIMGRARGVRQGSFIRVRDFAELGRVLYAE